MDLLFLALCATALSIERIAYLCIWRRPDIFHRFCGKPLIAAGGEPVEVLQKLFYAFKAIQVSVFIGWFVYFGEGMALAPTGTPLSMTAGGILIITGQILNFSVFYRLGNIGVFYGNKLGHEVSWCEGFPFSVCRHPQYVGALISVWGLFLVMRFPHEDWLVLPLIETLFYALGAHFERS
ncbi:MAG: hypothetical protein H0V62_08180 [Gammaproteobacteria bacterium]|nr:hypothetical protein [Gammaproteobacteria bacterium]